MKDSLEEATLLLLLLLLLPPLLLLLEVVVGVVLLTQERREVMLLVLLVVKLLGQLLLWCSRDAVAVASVCHRKRSTCRQQQQHGGRERGQAPCQHMQNSKHLLQPATNTCDMFRITLSVISRV